jgi:predicted molibdopterin-dependent oxidoreductase YjgC
MQGGSIPKLCATDNLEGRFGSCRLCLVEIDGMRGTPAAAPPRLSRAWWSIPRPRACKSCGAG